MIIKVRVIPTKGDNEVVSRIGSVLRVKVRTKSIENEANSIIQLFLAEFFAVASGKVAAAYSFAEKRVARKKNAFFFAVQADSSLGMPRCMDDFQRMFPELKDVTVLHKDFRSERHAGSKETGKTLVLSGSTNSFSCIDFFNTLKDPPGKSVLPILCLKSVSPLKR